jgi:hypothetical protein
MQRFVNTTIEEEVFSMGPPRHYKSGRADDNGFYACSAWEFAALNYQLKLKRLQNKVLRTIGNFPRRTQVRDLHMAFKLAYIDDYITKLCRQQA